MKRQTGYYHVILHREWIIGYWNSRYWYLIGTMTEYNDAAFQQIDENRIKLKGE